MDRDSVLFKCRYYPRYLSLQLNIMVEDNGRTPKANAAVNSLINWIFYKDEQ